MSRHAEWLSLIEISGPFLAVPVLKDVFPQGFEELDGFKRKRLRQAYDEWREAWDLDDPQFGKLHKAWIKEVLARGLELDEDGAGDVLKSGADLPQSVHVAFPEYGIKLSPDYAVVDEQRDKKPLLLVKAYAAETDLEAALKEGGWASSPSERMVHLCRVTGCRLGIVTNGERWMLIDAPVGAVTTFASWYARIWMQEPITLQAFVSLLGIRRFFLDEAEQLPALLDRSLKHQDEVTDALGEQVRRAVEVLIQSLDRADIDRNRELLHDVSTSELYEAGLTVMMRLVFLLCAEERGLLLMGDERYEANYAISTLRMQLRAESEEILERRMDAWSRLLATFRAVYGGIDHENLFMPALGGSLFDPDRFPFLEGRAKGTAWKNDDAKPLPIDNRTVLLLLDAIQSFEGRTLSYRALDVEQIGYVYEGLLERTVKRTAEVTLELVATKSSQKPWVTLDEVDAANARGEEDLVRLLRERSGSSESRIRNDLAKNVDDFQADHLLTACHGDRNLRDRVKRFFHLLRTDPWGYPLVYPQNAFIVTTGSDRRETGTHYTPKALTESIVTTTLEPVVYVGPAEGKPREEWKLKSSREILDLKVCDPAMGSGAFLVQVCRYLGEKLVEAWLYEEMDGNVINVDGELLDQLGTAEPLSSQLDERLTIARRLVAERCLYGVDINPLAVELAKLSIWLVTLSKGRPFGFLDHNLRSGDSLLGIHRLEQLTRLRMDTKSGQQYQLRIFGQNVEAAVNEVVELRKRIRCTTIRDIKDIEAMARLDREARRKLESVEIIANAMIGEVFQCCGNVRALDNALDRLTITAGDFLSGNETIGKVIVRNSQNALSKDLPKGKFSRKPFHWALEYPEVFRRGGFDGIVGNPPFLGGVRISETNGDSYNVFLTTVYPATTRKTDLCAYFFRRSEELLFDNGFFGLLATNTISQGTTRKGGLSILLKNGCSIIQTNPSFRWPGKASVIASQVTIAKGVWSGHRYVSGEKCQFIGDLLTPETSEISTPSQLDSNKHLCFQGSSILGMGFFLEPSEAKSIIATQLNMTDVVKPVMGGKELNDSPSYSPPRWIIDMFERDEAEARHYEAAFYHLEKHVKPERILKDPKKYPRLVDTWWKFWHSRGELYAGIKRLNLSRVLVRARVSDHHMMAFLPSDIVYTEQLAVFLLDKWSDFSILQSSIHEVWARRYASTLKTDVRYIPTDCFCTFPFPKELQELNEIGRRYYEYRLYIMNHYNQGMTKIYNRLHNIDDNSEKIVELRRLYDEIDIAVAYSYGWGDLIINHNFYETDKGIRYTVSEELRNEITKRLLIRNHNEHDAGSDIMPSEKSTRREVAKISNRTNKDNGLQETGLFDFLPQSKALDGGLTK